MVMRQQGIGPGLADHRGHPVMTVAQQQHRAVLVRVELADAVFVEEATCHPAEFVGAEPGLGFEPEGMEGAIVAGEEGGSVKVSHGWPPGVLVGLSRQDAYAKSPRLLALTGISFTST